MRIATCITGLTIHLLGNQSSVAIGEGWEGDLDQVIGVTDRGPTTVADALGPHLTDLNFRIAAPAHKKGPVAVPPSAKPHAHEKSQE